MRETFETFQNSANELSKKLTDKAGIKKKKCTDPAPLCSIQYIDAARYFVGDNYVV